jgi:hypothetical protein
MKKMFLSLFLLMVMSFGVLQSAGSQNLSFEGRQLRLIKEVGDRVVFFFEDGIDPDSGDPMPAPSVALAPITQTKQINFETGAVVIPGKTLKRFFLLDVYLRQRFSYRNDGQNSFRVNTLPVVELESVVFNNLNDPSTGTPLNGKLRLTLNGLFLGANKSLGAGESGADNRGNKDSFLFPAEFFDSRFGAGTAEELFKNDLTIHMRVENTVNGVNNFVAGTFTKVYGD